MVDRAALEMRCTGDCTGGSNPSLSATENRKLPQAVCLKRRITARACTKAVILLLRQTLRVFDFRLQGGPRQRRGSTSGAERQWSEAKLIPQRHRGSTRVAQANRRSCFEFLPKLFNKRFAFVFLLAARHSPQAVSALARRVGLWAFAEPDFLPHERDIVPPMASERGEKGTGERYKE